MTKELKKSFSTVMTEVYAGKEVKKIVIIVKTETFAYQSQRRENTNEPTTVKQSVPYVWKDSLTFATEDAG
jgi:predicted NUDIX family phosphoesterase